MARGEWASSTAWTAGRFETVTNLTANVATEIEPVFGGQCPDDIESAPHRLLTDGFGLDGL